MMKVCFEYKGAFPILLIKTGEDKFRVEYGSQVDYGNYEYAARKLGEAIMHSLNCEGKL